MTESSIRQGLDSVAQHLGLRPKRYSTKDAAIEAATKEFFKKGGDDGAILDLPPIEEKGQEPVGK